MAEQKSIKIKIVITSHLVIKLSHGVALQAALRRILDLVVDVLDVLVHVLLGSIHLSLSPPPLTVSHSNCHYSKCLFSGISEKEVIKILRKQNL